jgi:hypothetical protein
MQMKNSLPCVAADIGHHSISGFRKSLPVCGVLTQKQQTGKKIAVFPHQLMQ